MDSAQELVVVYSRSSARELSWRRIQALAERIEQEQEGIRGIRLFVQAPFLNGQVGRIRAAIAGALDPHVAYGLVDQLVKPWLETEMVPLWGRLGQPSEPFLTSDPLLRAVVLSVTEWDRFVRRLVRIYRQFWVRALPFEQDERVPIATPLVIECCPEQGVVNWHWKERAYELSGRRKVARVYSLDLVNRCVVSGSSILLYPREEELIVPPDSLQGIVAMIRGIRPGQAIYCGSEGGRELSTLTPETEWTFW